MNNLLKANKHFGQHFLVDESCVHEMLRPIASLWKEAKDLHDDDIKGFCKELIMEIGPGHGHLTHHLLNTPLVKSGIGHIVAIEKDTRFESYLHKIFLNNPERLTILFGDAQKKTIQDIILRAQEKFSNVASKVKIIANLPYNIATNLVLNWMLALPYIESITVMVQQEVAMRFCALPSTKDYGRLSIITQYCFEVYSILTVAPEAFYPPPKVFSTVIHLKPKNDVDLGLLDSLSYLTQCCFHNRRKTFINNIKNIFSQDKVCELMQLFSIPINARSEEINYQTFVSMAQWFKNTYQSMG